MEEGVVEVHRSNWRILAKIYIILTWKRHV